ncbi:MAG: carboxypeptidase regulatory-like domain-containing protein [Gemmatimonadota bacterium]|nr:MAG: carboxypeptidase regulatory-like domain-containing protein [Gemmatimonadota bacterium]
MTWCSPSERLLQIVPFLAALSAVSASVSAQVVRGRVLDDATGQPVAAVTIQLVAGDEGDSTVATDVTDNQGRFELRAPGFGAYRLQTSRIGYQPVTTQLFVIVRERDPLEVEVRISPVAVPLAPLTIVSERADRGANLRLETARYYDRKEIYGREGLGLGEFLGREELLRNNPLKVSDALRTVRGVRVVGAGAPPSNYLAGPRQLEPYGALYSAGVHRWVAVCYGSQYRRDGFTLVARSGRGLSGPHRAGGVRESR